MNEDSIDALFHELEDDLELPIGSTSPISYAKRAVKYSSTSSDRVVLDE